MAWEYSDKVLQLFADAVQGKPGTHMGELAEADGVGEYGSIVCGDALRLFFRVKPHPTDPSRDQIVLARFLTFGCTSAIASSEALCALLEERQPTPLDALNLTNQDLIDYLDGLPPAKIHCSVMGAEALRAAVVDWAAHRGVDLSSVLSEPMTEKEMEGRLVCKCFSITEPYLRRKIGELKLRSIEQITAALKAGGACGSCQRAPGGLQDLLDEYWGETAAEVGHISSANGRKDEESLSPWQRGKEIERLIATVIRPQLQKDGGDIELIDIKDNLVYCRLSGVCANCPAAGQTLQLVVEQQLKERIDKRLRVIEL